MVHPDARLPIRDGRYMNPRETFDGWACLVALLALTCCTSCTSSCGDDEGVYEAEYQYSDGGFVRGMDAADGVSNTDGDAGDGLDDGAGDARDGGLTADVSYDCRADASTVSNAVAASDWVQSNTQIEGYRYEASRDDDRITLTLLDEARESLGTLEIRKFFGTEGETPRVVEATFAPPEGSPIEVESDAVISDEDAFRTRTDLTRSGTTVTIRSEFKTLDCYANQRPDEGEAHPCAWPASVDSSSITVPTCGFDAAPQLPAAPNLLNLDYRIPVSSDPGVGGLLQTQDETIATFRAVDEGESRDSQTIQTWLQKSGADAIVGTTAEERLSAAYSDPVWMDHVETHTSRCDAERRQREAEQGLASGVFQCERRARQGLEPSDHRTARQGQGCGESGADCNADPHLRTIDGSSYNFQGAGEYILATAQTGEPFMLQARFEPVSSCRTNVEACQNVTLATAMATKIGGKRVGVYLNRDPSLWIGGTGVERPSEADLSSLPEGARIHQMKENQFRLGWPSGEVVTVEVREQHLDIHGTFPVARSGQIAGLWGYFNNVPPDDFVTREGRQLQKPLDRDTLYRDFGNSWRIRPDESLFDYQSGKNTRSYTQPSFPQQQASIDDLPENLRKQGEQACSDVEQQPDRRWCILDVACMCDPEVAESTEDLTESEQSTDMRADRPLTAGGAVCLDAPESLQYRAAAEPQCPPAAEPCIHLVREQTGVQLSSKLSVDATTPGTYAASGDLEDETLAAGETVDAYLLHLNEVSEGTGLLEGGAIFSNEIVGVVATKSDLDASDSVVGSSGRSYPSSRMDRGIDWAEGEQFEIGEEGRTLKLKLRSESGLDEMRVLTKSE